MKKIITVVALCLVVFSFSSCNAGKWQKMGYFEMLAIPIEAKNPRNIGDYYRWGTSWREMEGDFRSEEVKFTVEEIEGAKPGDMVLHVTQPMKSFENTVEEMWLYCDRDYGWYKAEISFGKTDERKVMKEISKDAGKFEKSESSDKNSEIWIADSGDTLGKLLKQNWFSSDHADSVREYYEQYWQPESGEEAKPEEQIEKVTNSPFVVVTVEKDTQTEEVNVIIDAFYAALITNIHPTPENFYNRIQENKQWYD